MDRRAFLTHCARMGGCALALGAGLLPLAGTARAATLSVVPGLAPGHPSPYFAVRDGGALECTLCPRGCLLPEGGRGACRVRENRGGRLLSLAYANPCAVNIDPIEKKPFFHVLPGTASFSVATAGCNFDCGFCQNWEISQAAPEETRNFDLPPAALADLAVQNRCRSVASTYVEPTVFMEYMQDIGQAARERGLLNTMHSNGFVNEKPLADLCRVLDAACVDLKGFTEGYYRDMTGGSLAPVLATLKRLRAAGVHLELVTLLVPGRNDAVAELKAMSAWVRDELGPDTPLHFTRFVPRYKLKSLQPTPLGTLEEARATALSAGLRYVYLGNVPGHEAENTACPRCQALLIRRVGYRTTVEGLKDGRCVACGEAVPGLWGP
jgi:pyruvate formate lyase activating enzyme